MLSLIMIFIDCIFRYFGKPLYFMHTLRYAIFVYGACCPWLLGGNENYWPLAYRGLGDTVFYDFFDLIYHGYWTSGYINCFKHELMVDGKPYGFLYANILCFEVLLFFLGKAFVWTSWDGFYRRNRWVQFMASFKGMFLEFYGFPYAGWATFFYKQHFVLVDLEDKGHVVTGRNSVVYWFSMALALWMTYEVAKSVWEIYTGNRDEYPGLVDTDPRLSPKKIQVAQTEIKQRKRFKVMPGNPGLPPDPDANPDDCQYIACYVEYWFMHQEHFKSAHNIVSQYYTTIWICRWVIFAIFSIVWYQQPVAVYISFLIMNLLMIWCTCVCKKSFRPYFYGMILAEEILVTIWHLAALILMADYGGKRTMKPAAVDAMVHLMFWPYIITILLEVGMFVIPLFQNKEYHSHFKTDRLSAEYEELVRL
jgi:hypothetical protein